MKKILISLFLLILCILPLQSENSIAAKMELYDSIFRTGKDNWYSNGYGLISVDFVQKNSRNVKSFLRVKAEPDPATGNYTFSIPRAYVKFRFPRFRAVIGKAPFSWGEGLMFNAGDLLFGDSAITANLMQSQFSDSEVWMTMAHYPLGPFSFLETLFLPPESFTGIPGNSKWGGRIVTELGNMKIESGYLYDGAVQTRKPYISLQGSAFINWHLSAAAAFRQNSTFSDSLKSSLTITTGFYSLSSIGYDGTLSYRVETQIRPYEKWFEYSAGPGAAESYGVYVYPEFLYSFNTNMSLILRGFISPVDRSAIIIPGFTWNVFQGFTFITMISIGTGEEGDTFAWEPESPLDSGFSILTGISVVY